MWPFKRNGHESCDARLGTVEEAVRRLVGDVADLQKRMAEDRLTILETVEKVSLRLVDRERKRKAATEEAPVRRFATFPQAGGR